MSFAATLPWLTQTIYLPKDRSLGTVGEGLRELLNEAAAPANDVGGDEIIAHVLEVVAGANRGEEVLSSVFGALQTADGCGTAVVVSVFTKTLEFMMALPEELPLPAVVVESEDEIGLDWDEDDQRVVSLTIDNSNQVGFSALFGREPIYGKVACVDGLPETLRDVLARLYPSARLS